MKTKATLAAPALFLAAALQGNAALILTVDPGDPAAVVFAAVANTAMADSASNYTPMSSGGGMFPIFIAESGGTLDGVRLTNFFAMAGSGFSSGTNSTLRAEASSSTPYTNANATGTEIRISTNFGGTSQGFSTASVALTGTFTANLAPAVANGFVFPAAGTTGDITALNRGTGQNVVIGQYMVVPEPSTALLCGVGVMALLRRRR